MTKQNGVGFLRVWVTTGGQSFPITGAQVEIREPGGALLYRLQTAGGGLTNTVELPAPAADETLTPEGSMGMRPYAVYSIQVECDGYQPVQNRSVSIFDGITAVQPVIMQPVPNNLHRMTNDTSTIHIAQGITSEGNTASGQDDNDEIYEKPYPTYDANANARFSRRMENVSGNSHAAATSTHGEEDENT